ncbi:MAG: protease inhibitor I42 family protein [Armatimonadetes bacterium]|nr:protease inhibitor I42 family protein [Armatimonadota bacterium]
MRALTSLVWIVGLLLLTVVAAHGYGAQGHRLITQKVFQALASSDSAAYNSYLSLKGYCPEIQDIRTRDASFRQLRPSEMVIAETPAVDDYRDIEFVNVKGGIGGGGRDDPHKNEFGVVNDVANSGRGSMSFTAFNHFIDIRKGPGAFDDYDGYSYSKGSGSKNQYQKAGQVASFWGEKLAANTSGFKVDKAVNWWFNDEYVHVSGRQWYKGCSPAMDCYSFFQDSGRYVSKQAELAARFPLANATGASGHGVPYSVFMPVDNMARYWYGRFTDARDPLALAPVMHAIQDASLPHHAGGCLGNWHSQYENDLEKKLSGWLARAEFTDGVKLLVAEWSRPDPSPPGNLRPSDWARTPSIDWGIDQLVTWIALNAYEEYRTTYGGFTDGYRLNEASAERLARLATAMSVTALKKAAGNARLAAGGDQSVVIVALMSQWSGTNPIPIAVLTGNTFTITLPSNRTTGYQWRLATSPDKEILGSAGSTYNAPSNGIPGQGGTETWTFLAVGKGSATIVLEYVQPWDTSAQPARTQLFVVTCGAPLPIGHTSVGYPGGDELFELAGRSVPQR